MPAQLSDDTPSAADPPNRPRRMTPVNLLRRWAMRIAWRAEPVVRLRFLPDEDALIVDIVPLTPVCDRVVGELLCIEFDGDDVEALPTAICLTGVTARPHSAAAESARHLLGDTLWRAARELIDKDDGAPREITLDPAVRDSRLRIWRRLTGVAIGVEILAGELRATLVGGDGAVIAADRLVMPDMEPEAVIAGITRLVDELRAAHRVEISGAPVVIGVQLGGPVDHDTGVVHWFRKRNRERDTSWVWKDVKLGDRLRTSTGLPVHVVNDVVGFATYERWAHPSPERCRAVMLISQGIGAKLIINGEVASRMPMEIGNIILHEDGRECDCGKRGCVEATAGTLAIMERIAEVTGRYVADIAEAVAAAEPDGGEIDQQTIEVFREAGRDLARGIGNVQAIANPSSWAIYGPESLLAKGSLAGDAFLSALLEYNQFVAYTPYQKSRVERHPILDDEGSQGAGLAAVEHFGLAKPEQPVGDDD